MNSAFPIDSSPGFIPVTNPFDGVEVGTVVNIPPEGAQVLIQTAKEGARVCRNLSRHERSQAVRTHSAFGDRAGWVSGGGWYATERRIGRDAEARPKIQPAKMVSGNPRTPGI
ncbi:hypothetical protein PQR53_06765 [Paraburkholderia fungorum]|uniref:hypothetical protein n=1 Tax=Paraburkholderia fungorum TaxID=134537 RepID=UPI0038B8A0F7